MSSVRTSAGPGCVSKVRVLDHFRGLKATRSDTSISQEGRRTALAAGKLCEKLPIVSWYDGLSYENDLSLCLIDSLENDSVRKYNIITTAKRACFLLHKIKTVSTIC